MDALVLDNVCKSFGEVRAVDSLSAAVRVGEIHGFLGPNGAGKTTTLRMVMDIIRPDSGRIEVLGAVSTAEAKDRIGYMPEERGLYRKMTARQVLTYFAGIKGVAAGQVRDRVGSWLERVGLSQWADRRVEELSRGMHQKLQFAVTCVNNPDLLVLDEPFSGLDPVNLEVMRAEVLRLRDEGATVLFSTHVMHEAERLCDAILLINAGQVVIDGPLEEIRSRYRTDAVAAELVGESGFVESLPMVRSVRRDGRRFEILLAEGADAQALLRALVDRVEVRSFQAKVLSLHEIFIRLVGSDHEQNS